MTNRRKKTVIVILAVLLAVSVCALAGILLYSYTYTLSPQTDDSGSSVGYTVTLTATETASTGYCKITRRASGSAGVDAAQSEAVLHVEESGAVDAAPSDTQMDAVAADEIVVDAGQTDTGAANGTAVDAGQTDTGAANETVFYTVQINNHEGQSDSITFTIYPTTENEQYTFEAVWGTYSGTEGRIGDKGVIDTQTSTSEAPAAEPETAVDGIAGESSDGSVDNTESISGVSESVGSSSSSVVTETQSETGGQSDATEAQSETEGRFDATEPQSETEGRSDATEAQSETEGQSDATEAQSEAVE